MRLRHDTFLNPLGADSDPACGKQLCVVQPLQDTVSILRFDAGKAKKTKPLNPKLLAVSESTTRRKDSSLPLATSGCDRAARRRKMRLGRVLGLVFRV